MCAKPSACLFDPACLQELADANKNTTVMSEGRVTGLKLTDQMEVRA